MKLFVAVVYFLFGIVESFKNSPVHILKSGKVRRQVHRQMGGAPVSEHMTTDVVTIDPNMKLEDCARLLIDKHIAGAPVVEDGCIIGVISQFDYLFKEAGALALNMRSPSYTTDVQKILAKTVRKAMTKNPFVVDKDTTIQEAAKIMVQKKIQRIPVVDNDAGNLVGIISVSDVMKHLLDGATSDKLPEAPPSISLTGLQDESELLEELI
uniref:CBS domain-containing protein n=1 Tax=Octactis speculum TaxID=3111310 RepID=A0A7S2GX93_9STRA|eukprot:CAMPEP_0185771680 /NCGR_PEP_ID=MMETSP1174-20130828/64623_1 /TAXON_ID=35687 /ORGANISM="Dictyocha speculum, Strain CCMP1381" /LENGTH=209 /DNA_ID=CAMNT_0028457605 /DNA_START=48 /DNA_END=677 /DNA_ORIENTATION=-